LAGDMVWQRTELHSGLNSCHIADLLENAFSYAQVVINEIKSPNFGGNCNSQGCN